MGIKIVKAGKEKNWDYTKDDSKSKKPTKQVVKPKEKK